MKSFGNPKWDRRTDKATWPQSITAPLGWLTSVDFFKKDPDVVFVFIICSHVFTWKSKNALSLEGAGCQGLKFMSETVLRVVPKGKIARSQCAIFPTCSGWVCFPGMSSTLNPFHNLTIID